MKFKYYLRDSNSDNETAIYLSTHFNSKRFKYSIGKSILPALWNVHLQKPLNRKESKKYTKHFPHVEVDMENILTRMQNVERELLKIIGNYELEVSPLSFTDIRSKLDAIFKKNKKGADSGISDSSIFFKAYLDEYIKGMKKGTVLISTGKSRGNRFKEGTIKNYKGFQTQWDLFEKGIRRRIRFDGVDLDLYNELLNFFNAKNLGINTVGRHIRCLKAVMNVSYDLGIHSNQNHKTRAFAALNAPTVDIYLTSKDLEALQSKKVAKLIKDRPSHQLALDVFLVGCLTAQRYSDYSRISPEYIKTRQIKVGDTTTSIKVLDMITKKTNERVIIPIGPKLDSILSKYDYKLPKTYEQKVNKYIKDIGELAGLTEPIEIRSIIGGKEVIKSVPKYKMIKSHSARRTGATLMYLAGIKPLDIAKITLHKTESNLMKYIKVSKEESADSLSQTEYFLGTKIENLKIVGNE